MTNRTAEPLFDERAANNVVSRLKAKFSELWNCTSDSPRLNEKTYDPEQQKEHEQQLVRLLDEEHAGSSAGDAYPEYFRRVRDCVRDLVLESVDEEKREQVRSMLDSFSDAGDEFVHRARAFDKDLKFAGIFQGLRNLWIINSMQAAFGIPICVNPSGFAYSLLYTYSDNYLDSTEISNEDKDEFSRMFGRRLAGFGLHEETVLMTRISSLVRFIEEEYPRDLFPEVFWSLLSIHYAQNESLNQRCEIPGCAMADILGVSVEKGGTSVVADAYLAKGRLNPVETEFAFGYGVFLQFIDDLQDVKEDLAGGSETLFTQAARRGNLDTITVRLINYVREVLLSVRPLHGPRAEPLTELIQQGSISLILESIALNPEMFSQRFARVVEPYSPLKFDAIRRLHTKRATLEQKLASHEEPTLLQTLQFA